MRKEVFLVLHGQPTILKTPRARLLYGIDLTDWIAETGSPLASVTADVRGVTRDGEAFIQGATVCAWIKGLDEAEGAVNSCTFAFACADGSADERTIYFQKRPA